MRYRINQVKISPWIIKDERKRDRAIVREVVRTAHRKYKCPLKNDDIINPEIIRESVDARKKPHVKVVYTVDFSCGIMLPFNEAPDPVRYTFLNQLDKGSICTDEPRPVVVGFGPCGMFAALLLAQAGLKPLVIERGKSVNDRIRDVEKFWNEASENGSAIPDPESNVQFGEGGAGTFSDGKLTTGIRDVRIRKVLQEFVRAGADPEILYKKKPHIGTDRLREIVKNIRETIEALGGQVLFETKFQDVVIENGGLKGIVVSGRNITNEQNCESEFRSSQNNIRSFLRFPRDNNIIKTSELIIAPGHSARDTFDAFYKEGFDMKQKPFSIGVRIEHPQSLIDTAQYGDEALAEILGPADYKLSWKCSDKCGEKIRGRGVYTFCMCPGGQVINASTDAGSSVTNGMSSSSRGSGKANSALLVDVRTEDFDNPHPLAGIEFQKKYERLAWENRAAGGMAKSEYGNFKDDRQNRVRRSIPGFASEAIIEAMPHLAKKLKGFDDDGAVLYAVETRSSSPVRILRDENMMATINGRAVKGVIPAGEGPGYAGGIMSAAVDGIKAAEMVIKGRTGQS